MNQPHVELTEGTLQVSFPYDPSSIAFIHSLGRAKWDEVAKHWKIAYSQVAVESLKKKFPTLIFGDNIKRELGAAAESQLEVEEKKFLPKVQDVEIIDFKFKTPPLWHQKVTFNFCRSLDKSAILLEQGLGKTKIAIDLATWRFRKGQVHRLLYVCPNSVTSNWSQDDVLQHLHDDFNLVTILCGSTKDKIKQLDKIYAENKPGWVICNYDSLRNLQDVIIKMQGRGEAKLFQQIINDESSKIKHAQSERSKASWRIGKTVRFKNIMTGTPITQTAEDAFAQYRFLDDTIFGPYATAFRGQYLIMGGFEQRQCVGYRDFSGFLKKMYSVAIRFTKERCLDLPPKVYERRTAVLDTDVSRQYKQFEKECVAEFAGKQISAPLVMTKIMKLSQVTGGFIYEQGEDGKRIATHVFKNNPKLDVLEEILEEVLPNKVIVWCRFVQELETIQEKLRELKIGHSAIHGGVKLSGPVKDGVCKCGECRGCAVRKFQEDPDCQVFVGQVATAGLGITLTAASTVVYYSNTYALEDRLQSEDRCHRIGQKKSVTYIDIVAELSTGKRTLDHDVLEVLRGKNKFAQEVSLALMQRMVYRAEERDLTKDEVAMAGAVAELKKNQAHVQKHSKNSDVEFDEEF